MLCAISYMLKNADDPCYSTKDQNSTYGERFYRDLLAPKGKRRLVKAYLLECITTAFNFVRFSFKELLSKHLQGEKVACSLLSAVLELKWTCC